MNSEDYILDPFRFHYVGDFDTQARNLLYHVRLTVTEVQNLRRLFSDLEQALQTLAPGLVVQPFGSIVTGLGIKGSDADCYIQLPNVTKPGPRYVILARNILRRKFRLFTNLFAITTAKVPIVKFLHIPTNCKCDVNFKSPSGVLNSQLIGHLLHLDPHDRVSKLAILVKYWAKVYKMTGTNLLSSYAVTLMVIFYLQMINILPSICEMQQGYPPYMIDNWNMGFNPDVIGNPNAPDSLYELLGGFFKCYSNLNFEESMISPFLGRLLSKTTFENIDDVPMQFELYKQNVASKICKPLKVDSPMCIQDPFELSRNCSGAVHARLAWKVKAHFDFAARMFDELPPQHFLKAILTENPATAERIVQEKQRHVFQNKVTKVKRRLNPRQRKHLKINLDAATDGRQATQEPLKEEPQAAQEPTPQIIFDEPIVPEPKPMVPAPALSAKVPLLPIPVAYQNVHPNVPPQHVPMRHIISQRPFIPVSSKKMRKNSLITCYKQLKSKLKASNQRGHNT